MFGRRFEKARKQFGIDGVIIVIAAIVFVASVYGLITASESGPRRTNELVSVGRFSKSANDVRRRSNTGFSWSNIRGTDTVYEGDSIFTGEQSTAAIQLDSGNDVKVEPNSLVVIRTRGDTAKFDLQYGSLFGKVAKGQKLLIETNGQQQEIAGDNAEIQIVSEGPKKETKVQVLKGEVRIMKVARETKAKNKPATPEKVEPPQIVKKDEVAKIDTNGRSEVKAIQVTLVSPATNSLHWLAPNAPMRFDWTRSGSLVKSPVTFELASDVEFSNVVFSHSLDADSIALGAQEKPEGTFYWRVRPESKNDLPSLPRRVSLIPDEPPLPRLPTEGQKLVFNADPTATTKEVGKSIMFGWEDVTRSKEFDVEVARDEGFGTIVYRNTVKSRLSDTSSPLPAGRYFWRVKGRHPDRQGAPWSRLMAFEVSDSMKAPDQPVFLMTELQYVLPPSLASQGLRGDVRAEAAPAFMWKAVEGAASYELEISKDPEFKNPTRRSLKDATIYALPQVGVGSTYARVRGVSENGLAGVVSKPAHLNVLVPPPTDLKIVEPTAAEIAQEVAKNEKHTIDVRWDSKIEPPAYELEWGADAKFQRSTRQIVKETHLARRISQPTSYFMRVRAVDKTNTPISEFTAPKVYTYKPDLRAAIAARENARVQAELAAAAAEKAKQEKALAEEKRRQEKADAAERRRKLFNSQREALSKSFTTHYQTKRKGGELREPAGAVKAAIPSPRLLEPASNTSLITLENSNVFVKLSWNPMPGAVRYQVQLSHDPDFESILGDTMTAGTRTIFQKHLPEGKVYWRVRQIRNEGVSGWSDPANINVLYE